MVYAVLLALGGLGCVTLSAGLVITRPARRLRRALRGPKDRSGAGRGASASVERIERIRPATVSVVVPALNEAESIGWVLSRIPDWVTEVILVDGRSVDATEIVASDLVPNLVVVHQPQLGKGAALRAGFAASTCEIILTLDADGSTNPDELQQFVHALRAGADFVKGSRHLRGGGSEDFTLLRRTGNQALVRITNLLYGSRFTDLCYGYCGFWRRHLAALELTAEGFEIETEFALRAVKAGLRIAEVPSVELGRRAGKSNLNAYRDGRRVLRTIMDERPGRCARRAAISAEIDLMPTFSPIPGTQGWLPAGIDRDRRSRDRAASGYTGPERRRPAGNKPGGVTTVYMASERPDAVAPAPELRPLPELEPTVPEPTAPEPAAAATTAP